MHPALAALSTSLEGITVITNPNLGIMAIANPNLGIMVITNPDCNEGLQASHADALRGALREDPDVILVGELRDLETIELALVAASTGHLVFGTLHTPSAAKTVDRIIDVFPAEQQNKIRATLSEALKGVIAQNLFKRIDKKGRVAALEILVFTTAIANLVREGKTHQIPGMIQVGKRIGNQPLDDAIMEHLRMKRVSPEEAYDKAIDKRKFRTFLPHPPDDDEN